MKSHHFVLGIIVGAIVSAILIMGCGSNVTGGGGGGANGVTSSSYGLPKTGQQPDLPAGAPFYAGDDCSYATPESGLDVGYPRGTGSWANYNVARFTTAEPVAGEVVVTDNATGLMWVADRNSAGCYYGNTRSWIQAIDFAEGLTFAGYSDWRLPNIKELQSILDFGRNSPAIDQTYFPYTTSNLYWSSSTTAGFTSSAWTVNFTYGDAGFHSKSNSYNVCPVRGGR